MDHRDLLRWAVGELERSYKAAQVYALDSGRA